MIDVFYFNLDSEVERNADFLRNYRAADISSDWKLHRYAASPSPKRLTGTAAPSLIAHHENRLGALQYSLRNEEHIVLMDDDVVPGRNIDKHVNGVIKALEGFEWDMVYLDLLVVNAIFFPMIYKMMIKARSEKKIDLVHLRKLPLTHCLGQASLVNGKSKKKLYDILNFEQVNFPIDLYLRDLVISGKLSVYFPLPYLVCASRFADKSTLSGSAIPDTKLYHAFNRLISINSGQSADSLLDIRAMGEFHGFHPDPELESISLLTQMLLSQQLGWHTPLCGFPVSASAPHINS